MKNLEVAKLFERTADVMAIQGGDSFRILAFRKIARTLEELPNDVAGMTAPGELEKIPGIGKSSAERIREYLRTGHIAEFESVWSEIPSGVMEIMKIGSVGPKTAALLWQEGGITSMEQLKAKLNKPDFGGLAKIPTLGAKKLEKIKANLAFLAKGEGRIRIGEALPIAVELVEFLRRLPQLKAAQYCGSLRRGRETIGDIDIAVAAEEEHGTAISHAVTSHPFTAEVITAGPTKTSIRTGNGVQVDVRVVPPTSYGAAVQYFTGSKEHNVRLRELAIKKGLKLNEWGLFKTVDGKEEQMAGQTEESVYHALGLACLPPEMREDHGEIELAANLYAGKGDGGGKVKGGKGAKRKAAAEEPSLLAEMSPECRTSYPLIELEDIRGEMHMHTTASDGVRTIEEMVAEAKRRGFAYCAITDHSKSQFQANGLKSDRLVEHIAAIHAVAKEAKGIMVLAGSEVDILADGSLDYEDELLAKLDWVIASPHAALSQESEPATTRLIRAIANPYVHVIGHPTGRIVGSRRGLEPDMQKVIFAAAREGVAMELNANYHRLDLRDSHLKMARDAGVPVCINTDAHDFVDLDQMLYGIITARRGWLRKQDVLNALPAEGLKRWLKERKQKAGW